MTCGQDMNDVSSSRVDNWDEVVARRPRGKNWRALGSGVLWHHHWWPKVGGCRRWEMQFVTGVSPWDWWSFVLVVFLDRGNSSSYWWGWQGGFVMGLLCLLAQNAAVGVGVGG